jgi:glycosyltransferase 2 family protein
LLGYAPLSRLRSTSGRAVLWSVRLAIGLGILVLLMRRTDPGLVLAAMRAVSPVDIAKAVVLFAGASLLLGGALLIMLSVRMNRQRVGRVFQAHLAGVLLSDLTPARAGYFFTPLLMERLAGVPKESGFAALVGVQAVSFMTKACLATAAIVFLGHRIGGSLHQVDSVRYIMAGSIIVAGIGIAFAVLVWTPAMEGVVRLLRGRTTRTDARRLLDAAAQSVERFRACGRIGPARVGLTSLLSAASTLMAGLALYVVARPAGLGAVSPLDIVMVSVAVGPIVYVPATPAGLGVVEAAYVLVLSAIGQSPSSALTFALAGRVLFTGTDIIGLPWLLRGILQPPTLGHHPRP